MWNGCLWLPRTFFCQEFTKLLLVLLDSVEDDGWDGWMGGVKRRGDRFCGKWTLLTRGKSRSYGLDLPYGVVHKNSGKNVVRDTQLSVEMGSESALNKHIESYECITSIGSIGGGEGLSHCEGSTEASREREESRMLSPCQIAESCQELKISRSPTPAEPARAR